MDAPSSEAGAWHQLCRQTDRQTQAFTSLSCRGACQNPEHGPPALGGVSAGAGLSQARLGSAGPRGQWEPPRCRLRRPRQPWPSPCGMRASAALACPSPERLPGRVPALRPPCPALCPQPCAPRPCPPGTPGSVPWPSPHVAADVAAPSASPSLCAQDGTLLVMLTSPWRGSCRFFLNLCLQQQKEEVSCRDCPGRVGTPGTGRSALEGGAAPSGDASGWPGGHGVWRGSLPTPTFSLWLRRHSLFSARGLPRDMWPQRCGLPSLPPSSADPGPGGGE